MSTALRALILCSILMIAASAFGQINIVNFDFGAVPVGCSNWNFTYQGATLICTYPTKQDFNQTPGFGWMLGSVVPPSGSPLSNGAGLIAGSGGPFCPPSFNGMPFNQAVFLESIGSFVWQEVTGFTAGSYTLSFYLGGRCGWLPQTVAALIDGNVIGTWNAPLGMPFTLETATFTVSAGGTHTLEFMGTNVGDATAFLSYVTIAPTDGAP